VIERLCARHEGLTVMVMEHRRMRGRVLLSCRAVLPRRAAQHLGRGAGLQLIVAHPHTHVRTQVLEGLCARHEDLAQMVRGHATTDKVRPLPLLSNEGTTE